MQVLSYTSPNECLGKYSHESCVFCVFWIIWRLQFVCPVRTSKTWNWSHFRYLTQVDFFSHVSYELSQPPQELLLLLLVQLLLLLLLLLRTMWVGDTITLRKTESFTPLFWRVQWLGKTGPGHSESIAIHCHDQAAPATQHLEDGLPGRTDTVG